MSTHTTSTERLLSTEEVADWLGVPPTTIYNWRTRHEGPRGFRVGRWIRFRREDVEAWIAEQVQRDASA
jgi:excisionase family DNA binding protein